MKKRYAPLVPDPKWYRPGDTEYARELIATAQITQRKAAETLGVDPRAMRYKLAGDDASRRESLSYPEQFVLEVLADRAQGGTDLNAVHEENPTPYEVNRPDLATAAETIWHTTEKRKLPKSDAGKIVVGYDKFGALIFGKLEADGFGLTIAKGSSGVGSVHIPISRLVKYTLLDPPAD